MLASTRAELADVPMNGAMRFEQLGPGHVRWSPRRGGLVVVLLLALGIVAAAVATWPAHGPHAASWTLLGLGALLAIGTAVALRCGTIVEVDRDTVRWWTRWPWVLHALRLRRSALGAIRVRPELRSTLTPHGAARQLIWAVDLRPQSIELPGPLVLWRGRGELRARRLAERWAAAAELPLEDAVAEPVSVRQPDELDARPRQRVAAAGAVPPASVSLDPQSPRAPSLWLRGHLPRARRWAVGALLIASLPMAAFACAIAASWPESPARDLALVATVVAELLLAAWLAFLLLGRTRVAVVDGELQVERWLFGARLRRRAVLQAAVVQVRVQTNPQALPELAAGVTVFARDRALLLGQGLAPEELGWVRAWLEGQLWPDLPVASEPAANASSAAPSARR